MIHLLADSIPPDPINNPLSTNVYSSLLFDYYRTYAKLGVFILSLSVIKLLRGKKIIEKPI